MLPIHLYALFGPLLGSRLHDLFGGGLPWALEEIHAPPQCLLDPVCALILSAVAGIHPQVTEARKSPLCPIQQRLDPLVIHHLGAVDLCLESTKPSVSTRICRFLPLTFLPPS
jgi:hypothetical protein